MPAVISLADQDMIKSTAGYVLAAAAGFVFLGLIAASMMRDTLKEINIGSLDKQ